MLLHFKLLYFLVSLLSFIFFIVLYAELFNTYYYLSRNITARPISYKSSPIPIRIACLVNTWKSNHGTRAKAVKETWGKRCDKLIFVSSQDDPELPSFSANLPDGRDYLWGKIQRLFTYAYENFLEEADWFFKADDDTYFIVENAKLLIRQYDSNDLHYIGCRFQPNWTTVDYMSGGAGYLMSRGTLIKFVEEGLGRKKCHAGDTGSSDYRVGECMTRIGVNYDGGLDTQKRYKLLPFYPSIHLNPGAIGNSWFWNYIYYPMENGRNCCSDRAISFHYITPHMMYTMDYLLYVLKIAF